MESKNFVIKFTPIASEHHASFIWKTKISKFTIRVSDYHMLF